MASVGKSEMEHMFDGANQMYDVLLSRFMILHKGEDKADVDRSEKDTNDYLTSLAKSAAFLAQTNSAISKSYKQEKRLKAIEEKLKNNFSIHMQMFEEPDMGKYR